MSIINLIYNSPNGGGGGGWQPGANTIAYYPLNSTTTTNDMKGSGTAYNLSTVGSPTFVTRGGVSCVYTDGVDDAFTQNSITTNLIGNEFSCLFWSYLESGDTGAQVGTLLSSGGYWGWNIENSTSIIYSEVLNGNQNNLYKTLTIPTDKRNLICITHDTNNLTTLYYNGVSQTTKTQALGLNNTHFTIGAGNYSGTLEYHKKGAISNVIIEDKARTATEILDYYDQTKGNYGL